MLSITVGKEDLRYASGRGKHAMLVRENVQKELHHLVDVLMRQLADGAVPVNVTVEVARVAGDVRAVGLAKGG